MLATLALSLAIGAAPARPPMVLSLVNYGTEGANSVDLVCPPTSDAEMRCSASFVYVKALRLAEECAILQTHEDVHFRPVGPGRWRATLAGRSCDNWTVTYLLESVGESDWRMTISSVESSPAANEMERVCSTVGSSGPVVYVASKSTAPKDLNCRRVRFVL